MIIMVIYQMLVLNEGLKDLANGLIKFYSYRYIYE